MWHSSIIVLAILSLVTLGQPVFAAGSRFLNVQVKMGQLRSSPSFLGSVIVHLNYGDRVRLLREQGPWKEVAFGGSRGWMHISALTNRNIHLQAGKANVAAKASSKEIALAGKGFNAAIETEFKSRYERVDYAAVDRMEALAIKPEQMRKFLIHGRVQAAEGVTQ